MARIAVAISSGGRCITDARGIPGGVDACCGYLRARNTSVILIAHNACQGVITFAHFIALLHMLKTAPTGGTTGCLYRLRTVLR